MKQATLCFIIENENLLLGMKKRGFGARKWNGFGGKINPNEKAEEAAIRELYEETGVIANKLEKVGELKFIFPYKEEWNQIVHVFLVKEWAGSPKESEEMLPKWFKINNLPFEKMWQDDRHWLPLVLNGKKVNATFIFDKDNETIAEMKLNET